MSKKDRKKRKNKRKRAGLQPYIPGSNVSQIARLQNLIGRMGGGYAGSGHITVNVPGGYSGNGAFNGSAIMDELGRLGGLVNTLVSDSKRGREIPEMAPSTATFGGGVDSGVNTDDLLGPTTVSAPSEGSFVPMGMEEEEEGAMVIPPVSRPQNSLWSEAARIPVRPTAIEDQITPPVFRPFDFMRGAQPTMIMEAPVAEEPVLKRPSLPAPPLDPASTGSIGSGPSVFVEDVEMELEEENSAALVPFPNAKPIQPPAPPPVPEPSPPPELEPGSVAPPPPAPEATSRKRGRPSLEDVNREYDSVSAQIRDLEEKLRAAQKAQEKLRKSVSKRETKQEKYLRARKEIEDNNQMSGDAKRAAIMQLRRTIFKGDLESVEELRRQMRESDARVVELEYDLASIRKLAEADRRKSEESKTAYAYSSEALAKLRSRLSELDELRRNPEGDEGPASMAAEEPVVATTQIMDQEENPSENALVLVEKSVPQYTSTVDTIVEVRSKNRALVKGKNHGGELKKSRVADGVEVVGADQFRTTIPASLLTREGNPSENALVPFTPLRNSLSDEFAIGIVTPDARPAGKKKKSKKKSNVDAVVPYTATQTV